MVGSRHVSRGDLPPYVNDANARGGNDAVPIVLLQVEDRAEAAPTLALPHWPGRLDPTLSGASL